MIEDFVSGSRDDIDDVGFVFVFFRNGDFRLIERFKVVLGVDWEDLFLVFGGFLVGSYLN